MPANMGAAALWAAPLDEAVQTILDNVSTLDDRRAVVYGAFLQAKVAVTLAEGEAALAKALVEATNGLKSETKRLVKITVWIAVASVVTSVAAGIAAYAAFVTTH